MAQGLFETLHALQVMAQHQQPGASKKLRLTNLAVHDLSIINFILASLSQHSFVKSLDMETIAMPDECLNRFMEGLSTTHLVLLRLVNMNIRNVSILTQTIQNSVTCRLRKLDLSWNHVGNQGAIVVANMIPHSNVEMVQLGRNDISDDGGIALARVFNHPNSNLKSLDLRMNALTDEFLRVVSEEIRNPNCIMCVLQLDENAFTYEGFKLLIESVRFSSNLTTLFFARNHLNDQAMQLFAQELPHFQPNMKKICFNGNHITPVGLNYINDAIKPIMIKLQHFDFRENQALTDESVTQLTETLRVHPSMEDFLLTPTDELLSQETIDNITRQLTISKSKDAKILLAMASVQTIPRIGNQSTLRVLPQEILRAVALMLIV